MSGRLGEVLAQVTASAWGSHDVPPRAGIGVYERGPNGLLAAARVYDNVEAPVEHP